jgi:hypothetical protein
MPIKACYSRGTTTVYPWSENAKALNDDKLMETTEEWLGLHIYKRHECMVMCSFLVA